jgi:hypothetical protein
MFRRFIYPVGVELHRAAVDNSLQRLKDAKDVYNEIETRLQMVLRRRSLIG